MVSTRFFRQCHLPPPRPYPVIGILLFLSPPCRRRHRAENSQKNSSAAGGEGGRAKKNSSLLRHLTWSKSKELRGWEGGEGGGWKCGGGMAVSYEKTEWGGEVGRGWREHNWRNGHEKKKWKEGRRFRVYVVPSAATAPLFGTNQPFLLLPLPFS